MSPPIRDGSGNDIGSIRLGDGSEVSEVRTGAGDVLFSGTKPVIEDFEDNSLSNFGGDTQAFTITTTNALEQNHSLIPTGGDGVSRISDTSLSTPPEKGDVISCLLRESPTSNNNFPSYMFGVSGSGSSQDGYSIQINSNDKLQIRRLDNGSRTILSTARSVGMTDGDIFDVEAQWHDGSGTEPDNTIVAKVFEIDQSTLTRTNELASISASDSVYANNLGIGFELFTTGTEPEIVADFYRITGSV